MSIAEPIPVKKSGGNLLAAISFTVTIFLSATLLFFVQPLFAKMVLPQIGGAPAVWTTAMLFFQLVLIAGYVYAHLLTRYVPHRLQLPVHVAFWAASLAFLPLAAAEGWSYDANANTTWQTLELFALGVGVPFALLSANAPLLQAWYVRSGGPSAEDPYFLYGASNIGSLLALLSFPLLAEPNLGAEQIGTIWAGAFVVFGALMILSGLQTSSRSSATAEAAEAVKATAAPNLREVGTWMFIAFVPSSLMLTITTKVSADLGALPLIWVIPLALYILSFVVAFSNRQIVSPATLRLGAIVSIGICAILMSGSVISQHAPISALLFAPALFIVAVQAHRTLYNRRPDAAHLTVFYISMSVGGALGGVFNSILAPALFSGIYEGYVTVVLAGVLLCLMGKTRMTPRALAIALLSATTAFLAFDMLPDLLGIKLNVTLLFAVIIGFALSLAVLNKHPVAIVLALATYAILDLTGAAEDHLFRDRSFFGAHKVYDAHGKRLYVNGTTIHGSQRVSEQGTRPTPLAYYHPGSPMAQIIKSDFGKAAERVGVVGLGVGALACYAHPGQTWDFYEIDEMVDRVARNPDLFSYMSECAPDSKTHLGDARIVLGQQDFTFDILYLDAYSSDSIPMHLLTREAIELYRARITSDGVLVFHISNRYYDIAKPLARLAENLNMYTALQIEIPENLEAGYPSNVVVLTPDKARFDAFLSNERWQALPSDGGPIWTDDFANPLSALRMFSD
ncbi:transporter [Tropicimonas sp. S265A]|uniref:spermidine synthase n=1 Tax=Tropicimonas sp. S265A TaxID=3415134 RepID=UPI003C7D8F17